MSDNLNLDLHPRISQLRDAEQGPERFLREVFLDRIEKRLHGFLAEVDVVGDDLKE